MADNGKQCPFSNTPIISAELRHEKNNAFIQLLTQIVGIYFNVIRHLHNDLSVVSGNTVIYLWHSMKLGKYDLSLKIAEFFNLNSVIFDHS